MSTENKSTELAAVETAVTSMNALTAGLADLSKRFKGVIYDVTTAKGMTEAKAARKEIAGPRIEVEKIRKAAKAPILELGRKLDAEAKRITEELQALEGPIDQQITAEENRIKAEREAALQAERDRVAAINARIDGIRATVQRAAVAKASGEIAELMNLVNGLVIDDSFAEMKDRAAEAKAEVAAQLDNLHAAAIAREEEAERIRLANEDLARRQAEQARIDAEREQREKAERERKAGIQRRLDWLRGNASFTAMSSPTLIQQNLDEIENAVIAEGEYAEFYTQALEQRGATVVRLTGLHTAAVEYQREQARQAEERQRQQEEQARIDHERAELEAAQRREREEREARERAEREAAERRAAQERAEAEERERQAEEARAALAQIRIEDIASMQHQVMIATGGRLGVREGGTRECIVETLEETKAWPVTEEKFGPQFALATRVKAEVVAKIEAELARWDAHEAEQERLRNYVPTLSEMLAVLADHYDRDAETIEGWLREKLSGKRKAAA
jgi:colicin import membrane protein